MFSVPSTPFNRRASGPRRPQLAAAPIATLALAVAAMVLVLGTTGASAKPTAAGAGSIGDCVKCTGSEGFGKCITESGSEPTTVCNCYSTWIQCSIAGCSQSGLDSNYNNCVKQVGPDGRLNAAKTCDPAVVCEGQFMGGSSTPAPASPTATSTPTASATPSATATATPSATPATTTTTSPSPTSNSAATPHATFPVLVLAASLCVLVLAVGIV